jgi:hypothetical protein
MARMLAPLLVHARHRHSIFRLKLLVPCSFIHVHTLRDEVLHFRFEAALPIKIFVSRLVHQQVRFDEPSVTWECRRRFVRGDPKVTVEAYGLALGTFRQRPDCSRPAWSC